MRQTPAQGFMDYLNHTKASELSMITRAHRETETPRAKLVCWCCSVVSNYLQPHGLPHTRLPCPSLSPRVCSNSCPLSRWCHPTISSSVTPSPPALNFSQHQGLFQWVSSSSGGQSTGASASASVLPVNIQDSFPFQLTGLISLQFKGLSRVFSSTTVQKHQFFGAYPALWSNSHTRTRYWKNHSFYTDVMSLLFNHFLQ